MRTNERDRASCRGCRKEMQGEAYMYGNNRNGHKVNHYGGYVCSSKCDFNSSLDLERSMPGHSDRDRRLSCFSQESFERNWINDHQ